MKSFLQNTKRTKYYANDAFYGQVCLVTSNSRAENNIPSWLWVLHANVIKSIYLCRIYMEKIIPLKLKHQIFRFRSKFDFFTQFSRQEINFQKSHFLVFMVKCFHVKNQENPLVNSSLEKRHRRAERQMPQKEPNLWDPFRQSREFKNSFLRCHCFWIFPISLTLD